MTGTSSSFAISVAAKGSTLLDFALQPAQFLLSAANGPVPVNLTVFDDDIFVPSRSSQLVITASADGALSSVSASLEVTDTDSLSLTSVLPDGTPRNESDGFSFDSEVAGPNTTKPTLDVSVPSIPAESGTVELVFTARWRDGVLSSMAEPPAVPLAFDPPAIDITELSRLAANTSTARRRLADGIKTLTTALSPIDDDFDVGEQEFAVVQASVVSSSNGVMLASDLAVVSVTDTDTSSVAFTAASSPNATISLATAREDGTRDQSAYYDVRLSSQPVANLTMRLSSDLAATGAASIAFQTPDGVWHSGGVDGSLELELLPVWWKRVGRVRLTAVADGASATGAPTIGSIRNWFNSTVPVGGFSNGSHGLSFELQAQLLDEAGVSAGPRESGSALPKLDSPFPADLGRAVADGRSTVSVTSAGTAMRSTSLTVAEGGAVALALALSNPPAAGEQVTLTLQEDSNAPFALAMACQPTPSDEVAYAFAGQPLHLTFTASDWSRSRLVLVTASDDYAAAGNATTSIALTITSPTGDPRYGSAPLIPALAVTVVNDDRLGLAASKQALAVVSGADATQNSAVLLMLQSAPLDGTVVLRVSEVISSAGPGLGTVFNATAGVQLAEQSFTFGPSAWNASAGQGFQLVAEAADASAPLQQEYQLAVSVDTAATTDTQYLAAAIAGSLTPATIDVTVLSGPSLVFSGTSDPTSGGSIQLNEGTLSGALGEAVYSVAFSAAPGGVVAVRVDTAGSDMGEFELGHDQIAAHPAELRFNDSNFAMPQVVTVTAVNDQIVEGAHSAAVTHTVTAAPAGGPITVGDRTTVQVAITDDDEAGVSVSLPGDVSGLSGDPLVMAEGSQVSMAVSLSAAPRTAPVMVTVSAVAATGSAADVLAVNKRTLTFSSANWNAPVPVTLTAIDDLIDRGEEQLVALTLATTSEDPLFTSQSRSVGVSISDNDEAQLYLSDWSPAVAEGGSRVQVQARLTTQPASPVSISLVVDTAGSGPAVAHAASLLTMQPAAPLEFDAETWNVPQTLTLSAATDDQFTGGGATSVPMRLQASTSDPAYAAAMAGVAQSMAISVLDMNEPGVRASQDMLLIDLSSGAIRATYSVSAASTPGDLVEVSVLIWNLTAAAPATAVQVSPSSFVLAAGSQAAVDINVTGVHVGDGLALLHVGASNHPAFNTSSDVPLAANAVLPGVLAPVALRVIDSAASGLDVETPAPQLLSATLTETADELVATFDKPAHIAALGTGAAAQPCSGLGLLRPTTLALVTTQATCALDADGMRLRLQLPAGLNPRGEFGLVAGTVTAGADAVQSTTGAVVIAPRLPVPNLARAYFSTTGAAVFVEFTHDAGVAGNSIGPCSGVFTNTNLGPGSGPAVASCSWEAARRLRIDLSAGATVRPLIPFDALAPCQPEHSLTLVAGAIRAVSESVNSASGCVLVEPPVGAVPAPVAVVQAPATLGSCDDLVLDAAQSQNGGGRAMAFEWTVDDPTSPGPLTPPHVLVAQSALVSALAARPAGDRLLLPADQLPAGHTLRFNVTVSHFLSSRTSAVSSVVTIASTPLPAVQVQGAPTREVTAARPLRLDAMAFLPTCGGPSNGSLSLEWRVVSSGVWLGVAASGAVPTNHLVGRPLDQFTAVGGRALTLPAGLLLVGGEYTLEVTASATDGSNAARVVVRVSDSALQVAIAGGDRTVGSGREWQLDAASSSRDPDATTAGVAIAPMSFSWNCTTTNGSACLDASSSQPLDLLGGDQGILAMSAGQLAAGRYTFSVVASTGTPAGLIPHRLRTGGAAVTIEVVAGDPPRVTAWHTLDLSSVAPPTSSSKADVSRRFRVGGLAEATSAVSYRWELLGQPAALAARVFATPPTAAFATVAPGVLAPGLQYRFRLTATDIHGQAASSTITVPTNAGPVAGYVDVTPRLGSAVGDSFSLEAPRWTDDPEDLPLQYLFGYYKAAPGVVVAVKTRVASGNLTAAEAATLVPFQPLSAGFSLASSFAGAMLPQGTIADGFNLTIAVRVRDALGAQTESIVDLSGSPVVATVKPPVVQSDTALVELAAAENERLDAQLASGDASSLLATINAVSSMLQSEAGAISPCEGVECASGEECLGGVCFPEEGTPDPPDDLEYIAIRCDESSFGMAPSPNPFGLPVVECSGHGQCLRSPPLCEPDDPRGCTASCQCDEGWDRRDCAKTTEFMVALRNQNTKLLESQLAAVAFVEPTAESVSMHANSLSALTDYPDSLNLEGMEAGLGVAQGLGSVLLDSAGPAAALPASTANQLIGVAGNVNSRFAELPSARTRARQRALMHAARVDGWDGSGLGRAMLEVWSHGAARGEWSAADGVPAVEVETAAAAIQSLSGARPAHHRRALRELMLPREEEEEEAMWRSSRRLAGSAPWDHMPTVQAILGAEGFAASADSDGEWVDRSAAQASAVGGTVRRAAAAAMLETTAGEPPLSLGNADRKAGIAVSMARQDSSGVSGASIASGADIAIDASAATGTGETSVDLMTVDWTTNPFHFYDDVLATERAQAAEGEADQVPARFAGITGVSLLRPGDPEPLPVEDVPVPMVLRVPIPADSVLSTFSCVSWDEAAGGGWSYAGMALVDVEPHEDPKLLTAVCASVHLTDFSGVVAEQLPGVVVVDPFGDAGSLKSLLDPKNIWAVVGILLTSGILLLAWLAMAWLDRCRRDELNSLRDAHILRHGEIRTGIGQDKLHRIDETGGSNEVPRQVVSLAKAHKRGVTFLALHLIFLRWVDALMRNHSWLAVFTPPLEDQLIITRPQRVLILVNAIMIGTMANALLFGTNPENVSQHIIIGIIGSLVMQPVDWLMPMLFEHSNTLPTEEEDAAEAEEPEQKNKAKETRRQRRARLRQERLDAEAEAAAEAAPRTRALPSFSAILREMEATVAQGGGAGLVLEPLDVDQAASGLAVSREQGASQPRSDLSPGLSLRTGLGRTTAELQRRTGRRGSDASAISVDSLPSFAEMAAGAGSPRSLSSPPRSRRQGVVCAGAPASVGRSSPLNPDAGARPAAAPSASAGDVTQLGMVPALQDDTTDPSIAKLLQSTCICQGRPVCTARSARCASMFPMCCVSSRVGDRPEELLTEERLSLLHQRQRESVVVLTSIVGLTQAWAGALGLLFGVYIILTFSFQAERGWGTFALVTVGGLLLGTLGFFGYRQGRRGFLHQSVAFTGLSVATQVLGGFVMSPLLLDLPFKREVIILVFGLQMAPLAILLLGFVYFGWLQGRMERQLDALTAVPTPEDESEEQQQIAHMAKRLQSQFRRWKMRARAKRRKRLTRWEELSCLRQSLRAGTIGLSILLLLLMIYLSFLYVIKFDEETNIAWITGTLISLCQDAFVWEPVTWLFWVVYEFFKELLERSADESILTGLASRLDVMSYTPTERSAITRTRTLAAVHAAAVEASRQGVKRLPEAQRDAALPVGVRRGAMDMGRPRRGRPPLDAAAARHLALQSAAVLAAPATLLDSLDPRELARPPSMMDISHMRGVPISIADLMWQDISSSVVGDSQASTKGVRLGDFVLSKLRSAKEAAATAAAAATGKGDTESAAAQEVSLAVVQALGIAPAAGPAPGATAAAVSPPVEAGQENQEEDAGEEVRLASATPAAAEAAEGADTASPDLVGLLVTGATSDSDGEQGAVHATGSAAVADDAAEGESERSTD